MDATADTASVFQVSNLYLEFSPWKDQKIKISKTRSRRKYRKWVTAVNLFLFM